jgi:hypothetical protein
MKKTTESYFDNERAKLKKYTSMFKKKHPEVAEITYPEKLTVIFERYIEVYGHAYCMDVKKERKKTARILYDLLCELRK